MVHTDEVRLAGRKRPVRGGALRDLFRLRRSEFVTSHWFVVIWIFSFGRLLGNSGIDKLHLERPRHERHGYLRRVERARKGLDASRWESFSRPNLERYFGCSKLFETPRPIITGGEWRYFRDLYNQHVAEQDPDDPDVSYKMKREPFDSPVEGAFTTKKGRGLIASRDIAKGEKIFQGSNNTIVFETGHSWRKFVWHLGHAPPMPGGAYGEGFACDVLAWSWTQRVPGDGPMQIVVDIDESSLLNQPPGDEDANVRCGREGDKKCGMDYYAVRHIARGDEILCEYSDFSEQAWNQLRL